MSTLKDNLRALLGEPVTVPGLEGHPDTLPLTEGGPTDSELLERAQELLTEHDPGPDMTGPATAPAPVADEIYPINPASAPPLIHSKATTPPRSISRAVSVDPTNTDGAIHICGGIGPEFARRVLIQPADTAVHLFTETKPSDGDTTGFRVLDGDTMELWTNDPLWAIPATPGSTVVVYTYIEHHIADS